eukprot:1321185-Amorphochlora_amoeboformis.AAC.1
MNVYQLSNMRISELKSQPDLVSVSALEKLPHSPARIMQVNRYQEIHRHRKERAKLRIDTRRERERDCEKRERERERERMYQGVCELGQRRRPARERRRKGKKKWA